MDGARPHPAADPALVELAEARARRDVAAAVMAMVVLDGVPGQLALVALHRRVVAEMTGQRGAAEVAAMLRLVAELVERGAAEGGADVHGLAGLAPQGRA